MLNEKRTNEKLTVFDRDGVYIATKKIGKNNPKVEQIKKDNDMRKEWNKIADVAHGRDTKIRQCRIAQIRKRIEKSKGIF